MSTLTAQINFNRGLAALIDDNFKDAAVFFRRAMEIERQRNVREPDMRFLSYYGLSLAKSHGSINDARQVCLTAVSRGTRNPDLFLNLGLVCLLDGDLSAALAAFESGLDIASDHAGLNRERARVDRRSAPVLRVFGRNHLLNRCLGRVKSTLTPGDRRVPAIRMLSPH